jgi:PiT family inorganic phosphate transporter
MTPDALLLFAAAGAFAMVSGANDGGALVSSGMQLRSVSLIGAIGMVALALVMVPLLLGTGVATTLATALLEPQGGTEARLAFVVAVVAAVVVVAALTRSGVPTSLTLALIGGIAGAAVGFGLTVEWRTVGVVLLIALLAPLAGGVLAWGLIRPLRHLPLRSSTARLAWGHRLAYSAQCVAYAANDGQKALAILAIAAGTATPRVTPRLDHLVVLAALFSVGLILGVRRVAAKLARAVAPVRPLEAVSVEAGSAMAVLCCTALGAPVSMTQSISGALVGAGLSHGFGRVRWQGVTQVAIAWIVTLPAAAALASVAAAVTLQVGA